MPGEWKKQLQTYCIIPQRYLFGIMGFIAVINVYTMRSCVSVTITEIVTPTHSKSREKHTRDWTEVQKGLIHGGFYWGYIATHIPGGLLAQRFGGKYTLSIGLLFTAVLTLLTPIMVEILDWPGLLVVRILEGLGEGTTFPALTVLLAHWVPLEDRAKMGCLVFAGNQIGTVISYVSSGFIIEATGSWASVFYLYGCLGVLWCIIWQLVGFSDPSTHPYIREAEKWYLARKLTSLSNNREPTPWPAILTSVPVWALVIGQVGHDWVLFAMISDLPKYIKVALDLTLAKNGMWCSVPYLVMWACSMTSGFVADYLINNEFLSITNTRRIFTVAAAILPAVFILIASYAGSDSILVMNIFTIAMGSMGPFYAGLKVNPIDLSPNFSGIVMAIVNGLGAVSGIITPYIIDAIILKDGDPILKWRIVFWITLGVAVFTSIVYFTFSSGEEQYWNNAELYKERREAARVAKEEKAQAKRVAKEAKAAEKQAKREAEIMARQNAT